jgi:hypothetical protein
MAHVYTVDMKHYAVRRYPLTSAIESLVLLFVLLFSTPAQASPVGYKFNPAFKPIIPRLARVLIPIALPYWLPRVTAKSPAYADASDVSSTTYVIDLSYTRDCHGANACRLGSVTGGWTADTPGVLFTPTKGTPVKLHGGVVGVFYPFQCGASCGDSLLMWHKRGIPYTVSVKGGSKQDTVAMANSALDNTFNNP